MAPKKPKSTAKPAPAKSGAKAGKAASAARKPEKPVRERAVAAALDLAARMGWDMVTMADIADKAHIGLSELADIFDGKDDVLTAYGRQVDRRVLEAFSGADDGAGERDRLFEILMERMDILNEDREAVQSILKSFLPDPKQAVISLPHLARSMAWMMEAAGLSTSGVKGAVRVFGLTIVYLTVLRHWMKDESEDLSVTMAALDRALGHAEKCANTFML
ncbi:MAG: TetR family transcriptional regulator [Micavibrio sp.]